MLTPRAKDFVGFLVLNAVLALGGYLALAAVRVSQAPLDLANNPTPLGYTWSLALFAIPCLIFGVWLVRFDRDSDRRKAFFATVLLLAPVGIVLDVALGYHFFVFPNREAVLGIHYPWLRFPAYNWQHGLRGLAGPGWVAGYLLVEEFLFYGLGFAAILLSYIWCEAVLFGDAKSDRQQPVPKLFQRWWSDVAFWLVVGAALFAIALAICRWRQPDRGAFPGYFLFLLLAALIPSMVCFRVAFHFVHWRALTVAWLFVLAISQFWEATLALPYQWWDYRHPSMMGIFVRPHCDLPLEALLVWSLGTWAAVVIHETLLAALRLQKQKPGPLLQILRGTAPDLATVKNLEHRQRHRGTATTAPSGQRPLDSASPE